MQEVELKFQVLPARAAALGRAIGAAPAQRLQAAYFDTADRALADAGVALRLRREGRRWVQTLKAAGRDGMTRLEHNVPRPGALSALPPLDPSLHAGTPAFERLQAALAGRADTTLGARYRTDIRRRTRVLRSGGAVLELAFDQGAIHAGDRRLAVLELEVELVRGAPAALIALARRWVQRHGLWLDTRSKAERGDLLARDQNRAPARKARSVTLDAGMDLPQARRAVLAACLEQVATNASQVASGDFGDEHLHQLRVGLRRLRTALRLFDAGSAEAPLAAAAAGLFRALGAARDLAAVGGPLREQLARALAACGLALEPPALPQAEAGIEPVQAVRSPASQDLLLDLLAAVQPAGGPAEPPAPAKLEPFLARRLNRWHRQVVQAAGHFAELDDTARHQLRKRVKRLRYAVEFAQGLYAPRRVRRYLRPLAALQERLGALNDVVVALDAFRGAATSDAAAVFALGWLAARRESLAVACEPALETFGRARRPWKD